MPFGIRSAPEVFQRKIHELIQGMPHVEVAADDFVVVGCGDTRTGGSRPRQEPNGIPPAMSRSRAQAQHGKA